MTFSYLSEFHTARGRFKVMIVGQPEGHLMDWNGCNFKRLALPTSMRRVFDTLEKAKAYKRKLRSKESELAKYARNFTGAYFRDKEMA